MMSWCRIYSGTLFSGVDEEGKVPGIHYDLEKLKKGKNKILMKLSLILDESFKDTLITIVDECVKMKFNNIECQYLGPKPVLYTTKEKNMDGVLHVSGSFIKALQLR
jgi:hypothetical protein